MFWHVMTPGGSSEPQGDLAFAIDKHFGSLVPSLLSLAKP
jgi:superoxide dismutase